MKRREDVPFTGPKWVELPPEPPREADLLDHLVANPGRWAELPPLPWASAYDELIRTPRIQTEFRESAMYVRYNGVKVDPT